MAQGQANSVVREVQGEKIQYFPLGKFANLPLPYVLYCVSKKASPFLNCRVIHHIKMDKTKIQYAYICQGELVIVWFSKSQWVSIVTKNSLQSVERSLLMQAQISYITHGHVQCTYKMVTWQITTTYIKTIRNYKNILYIAWSVYFLFI